MSPRPEVVEQLVSAALTGMEFGGIENSTGDEVLSACFTLAKRAMKAAILRNPAAITEIQNVLQMLMLDCVPPTVNPKEIQ